MTVAQNNLGLSLDVSTHMSTCEIPELPAHDRYLNYKYKNLRDQELTLLKSFFEF